jgi:hypothetical protein
MKSRFKPIFCLLALVTLAAACASQNTSGSDSKTQTVGQNIVNQYMDKANAQHLYPIDQMNTFLELMQQREKLLRFNNPAKLGYVYVFNPGVKEPIGYYTIKGKVSSTNSQMTPTDQVYWTCKDGHGCQPVVVKSPSDDGSYGENEPGYFFFTTEDVYVFVPQMMSPIYQDAPMTIFNVPQFNNASDKPTSVGETEAQRAEVLKKAEQDAKNVASSTTVKPGG